MSNTNMPKTEKSTKASAINNSGAGFQSFLGQIDKAVGFNIDEDSKKKPRKSPAAKSPSKTTKATTKATKTTKAPKKEISYKLLNLTNEYFEENLKYLDSTFDANNEIVANHIRKLKKIYDTRILDDSYFAMVTSVIDDYKSAIAAIDLAWRSTKLGSTLATGSNMVQYIHNIVCANQDLLTEYGIEWNNNRKEFIGSFQTIPINDITACSFETLYSKEGDAADTMTFGKSITYFLKDPVAVFELIAFGWFIMLENIRFMENIEMEPVLKKKNIDKILLLSSTTIATQKPLMNVIKRKPKKKTVATAGAQEEVSTTVIDETPKFDDVGAEESSENSDNSDEVKEIPKSPSDDVYNQETEEEMSDDDDDDEKNVILE
ncbi:hypothetical protein DLEV_140 [Diachasmimorpha longicaudata entomopoxvirus]|uniref:Uncharacterized protein n=1 Tax=Diachasmimorpha longicaudata entomopoxvirus TaxID=109981 RepID=A0A7R5WK81_9POXV|nr:hypothetical protein QKK69_gp140 [Diachasmimorpha longicaudata entomopoxvirus]AKS26431.1 hypothetical protein DLEV_140 [Diachasmimorpha longicaudata entomopoxvirus]